MTILITMAIIGHLINARRMIMKKNILYLLAAIAFCSLSCSKEIGREVDESPIDNHEEEQVPTLPVKTITFSASIELSAETKATLNDHSIEWASGDYIGIATEQSTTVTGYAVTPGVDPKTCTFTVAAVDNAENYYAIYTGSSDFTGIIFNTETKTFSGTATEKLIIKHGRFDTPTITHKEQLSMAGKANSNTASIKMKPCLALAKVRVGEGSVSKKHDGTYSGVRGFNFYQDPNATWDASTPYCSGDYTVCLSGDDLVVSPSTTITTALTNYRDLSTSELLSANTDYYFSFIPGGDIDGFRLDFTGFKNDSPTYSIDWGIQYTYKLIQSMTVKPGDYFDFGTFDPVASKKDAASFDDFAITIDGVFTDWASVTTTGGYSNGYTQCKVTYDKYYIYFYSKTTGISWHSGNYFYYCLDTDNKNTTGGDLWGHSGFESIFYISPCTSTEGTFVSEPSIHRSYPSSISDKAKCAGTFDSVNKVLEIEVRVPRTSALVFKNDVIRAWTYASDAGHGDDPSLSGYFNLDSTVSITN